MSVELTAPLLRTPTSPVASRRVARSILVVFLVAFAVSLAMAFVGFRSQGLVDTTFDPYSFGAMGKSLARGEGFDPYGAMIQRRAPLYPLMIGGVYFAFGEQPSIVVLLQAALLAATAVLAFDMGRRLFNHRTGLIAAALVAFNPMVLRYVGDLHLETLLTFLFTLTVWASVLFYERPNVARGALLGAATALAALTKAVILPYPFLFAAVLIGLTLLKRRRGVRASLPIAGLAAMFIALFAVIAPWTIRNYFSTGGKIVLISTGASDAFLRGYIFSRPEFALLQLPPYTDAENESNAYFESLSVAAGTTWQRDDVETDQILNRAAVEKFRAEPAEFVRKFATGMFTFWYQMTSLPNSVVSGVLALGAWVLVFFGLGRARREGKPLWLLLLPPLYLNVFLAALLALGRYSVPVLPALLVASAFGIDTLLTRWRASRA